jgi:hypothetical protein
VDTDFFQRPDLIVHQGDQRGHHHGDTSSFAVPGNGRNLITQAFAATGRHQDKGVPPVDDVIDDGLLMTTESTVAKDVLQDREGRSGGHGRDCGTEIKKACRISSAGLVP